MPDAAKGTSDAAAKAFVKHYIAVLNYAGRTGDTAKLRELSSPSCAPCQDIIDSIRDLYAAGGRIEGDDTELHSLSLVPGQSGNMRTVDGLTTQPRQLIFKTKGAKPEHVGGGKDLLSSYTLEHRDGWRMAQITSAS